MKRLIDKECKLMLVRRKYLMVIERNKSITECKIIIDSMRLGIGLVQEFVNLGCGYSMYAGN